MAPGQMGSSAELRGLRIEGISPVQRRASGTICRASMTALPGKSTAPCMRHRAPQRLALSIEDVMSTLAERECLGEDELGQVRNPPARSSPP